MRRRGRARRRASRSAPSGRRPASGRSSARRRAAPRTAPRTPAPCHDDRRAGRGQVGLRPGLAGQRERPGEHGHVDARTASRRGSGAARSRRGAAATRHTTVIITSCTTAMPIACAGVAPGAETDDVQGVQQRGDERDRLPDSRPLSPLSDSTARPPIASATAPQVTGVIRLCSSRAANSGVATTYMPGDEAGHAGRGVREAGGLQDLRDAVQQRRAPPRAAATPGDSRRRAAARAHTARRWRSRSGPRGSPAPASGRAGP